MGTRVPSMLTFWRILMADLVPEYLTFDYHCHFRGAPGASHDPEDYPVFWTFKVKAMTWEDDNDDEGKEVSVAKRTFT